MTRHARSITTRLGIAIALILGVGAVVMTIVAYSYGRTAADEAYDRMLAGAALQISENIVVRDGSVAANLPVSAFELLALAPEDRIFYRIVAPDGATITGYEALPLPPPYESSAPVFYDGRMADTQVRLVAVQHPFAERDFRGTVTAIVAHTTLTRATLARDITTKALIVIAGAGIAIVALAFFTVRISLSPLTRIERALASRDPKNLAPLEVPVPREVEIFVAAINRFMARLGSHLAMMQSFIGETAHQLRTPITAVRAQAELAIDEQDPQRLRQIVAQIHKRAVGMGRLADQLLSHALIIHRSEATPLESLDLCEIALHVAEESEMYYQGCNAALKLDLPASPVPVTGDAVSLSEAAKNLVSNAFRYGRPPVTIAVRPGNGHAYHAIAVSDHGTGIPDERLAEVGQRFVRSAASPADGAGLGLAIVSAVANAHGGRLVLSRPAEGVFRAAIEIPAANGRTEQ